MKKVLKKSYKLTLEEEYAFEHKQRIKAEKYIEEIWAYCCELTKEVKKLQSIIDKGEHLPKEKSSLNSNLTLKMRLKKIYKDREKAIKKMEKRINE